MATLQELQPAIDAGLTVERKETYDGGYQSVEKAGTQYEVFSLEGIERFASFEDLLDALEPMRAVFPQDAFDTWQFFTPPTREEQARYDAEMAQYEAKGL